MRIRFHRRVIRNELRTKCNVLEINPRVQEAVREYDIEILDDVWQKFTRLRHLTKREQDQIIEDLRKYPKLLSLVLEIQRLDE